MGTGGDLQTCLYVKGVQKFLSSFKSHGSRGSAACDWSAASNRGASRDPLVRMDQNAGYVIAQERVQTSSFGSTSWKPCLAHQRTG